MTAPSWSPNTRDTLPNWSDNDLSLSATAPTITTTTLADVAVGAAMSVTLAATGSAPIAWGVSAGALPAWASLSPSGVLSGDAATAPGLSSFTVQATNSAGSDTQALTLLVPNEATGGGEIVGAASYRMTAGQWSCTTTYTMSGRFVGATGGAEIPTPPPEPGPEPEEWVAQSRRGTTWTIQTRR